MVLKTLKPPCSSCCNKLLIVTALVINLCTYTYMSDYYNLPLKYY